MGGDLAAADYPPPPAGVAANAADPTDVTCEKCHDPSRLRGVVHHKQHLDKIACETCHIRYTSGITYSLYGHGAHLAFGRNAQGKDTKLITLDHMQHHRARPTPKRISRPTRPRRRWSGLTVATSFLAQTLAVRGSPNAKIAPFKPMANGMVFDARFFRGDNLFNAVQSPYNAYSMYRFFANAQDDCAPGKPAATPRYSRRCGFSTSAQPRPAPSRWPISRLAMRDVKPWP